MSYLLNNSGGKILFSGESNGSALLLSGLATPLLEIRAVMSISEQDRSDVTRENEQGLSDGSVQLVTSETLQGLSDTAAQDVTNITIQTTSQEHVQDVD